MAKTLIYVAGSPTSVKIGDTDTDLYLQIAKDNVVVNLTAVTSITVKIADTNKNYLKDISISSSSLPDGDKGILVLPLNSDNIGGLNSGDYYFEVWIVTTDNETEIYPDMNVTKFHVFNNIVGGTSILTTLTIQAFLDRITSTQNASETSLANSQTALSKANTANTNAAKALSDLNAGNYLTKDTLSSASAFQNLQTQVNDSAVGTNLFLGSSDFSGNWSNLGINWSQNGTYKSLVVYTRTGLWNGIFQGYTVPSDGNYTFSAYAKQEVSNVGTHISTFVNGSAIGDFKISSTTFDWTRVSFTKKFKANDVVNFKIENDAIGKLSVCGYKLEKGSAATDWCLNPAEILTKSDYAKIQAAIVALGGSL